MSDAMENHLIVTEKQAPWEGTVPHTIAQALQDCTERRKKPLESEAKQTAPIDLLVVVLTIEALSDSLVRFWICDTSLLPSGGRAQVVMFGKVNHYTIFHKLMINSGDVVRFNRVDLRFNDSNFSSPNDFVFWHSWQDPEIGVALYRFCNIGDRTEYEIGNEINCGEAVPSSMRTQRECLITLISWYRQSSFMSGDSLQPLPYFRRTLAELMASTGVISHTVAYVVEVVQRRHEKEFPKRNRGKNAKPNHYMATFATLSDDDGATMATLCFGQSTTEDDRFRRILESAKDSKTPVRFSHVIAKPPHTQPYGSVRRSDEVILMPSANTEIALATKCEIAILRLRNAETQSENSLLVPIRYGNSLDPVTFDIRSPLFDMIVKGQSLAQIETLDVDLATLQLHGALEFTEKGNKRRYRSVVVKIKLDALDEFVLAEADGSIVKCLCGGLEIDEWSPLPRRNDCQNQLGGIVASLVHNLIVERIELQWLVERVVELNVSICYKIRNVSLPELYIKMIVGTHLSF